MLRNLGTIVLMLLLATPLAAVAQNTGRIAGTVTDDLGDPLPGANVVVEGTQLGAATDIDGNYYIIGVPVGEYDVTASFVGYASQTISGLQVSTGYTTEQNFELGPQELGQVDVVYERPIIQRDALGAPRVVTGEEIENLPIRGVSELAAIQAGVVNNEGSGDLFIRGGRNEEVAYYVDGVKVTSGASVAVNQRAIQEQEMLIGTIPARYGDVLSGVISITTKSGGSEFFGSAELITSEVLDAYGYNVGSLSIGGPIASDRASFFLSAQGQYLRDSNPYGVETFQLSDEAFTALSNNPQVFRITNEAGDEDFIPVPVGNIEAGTPVNDVLENPGQYGIELPDGYSIANAQPISASQTFTAADFETDKAKDNPYQELILNGNVTVEPLDQITLRVGGAFDQGRRETYAFGSSLYNRDNFSIDDQRTWRVHGTLRQRLSNAGFYQIQASYQNFYSEFYPQRFSSDITNILRYGDISDPANAVANNYLLLGTEEDETGNPIAVFTPASGDGEFSTGSAYGLFSNPGSFSSTYRKQDNSLLRFAGSATTQLGVHQIEFGAEFEQSTRRFFQVVGSQLARYVEDADGVEANTDLAVPEGGYDQVAYQVFRPLLGYSYYGYSYNGLEEVDDQDIAAFEAASGLGPNDPGFNQNPSAFNVAPYKPIYYAGYIQDKVEFRDLVVNVGLRVDVFDNNTLVVKDIFSPFPITRAGDLDNFQQFADAGIEGDYAAYFSNPNDPSTIVGFRDLDGNFYDLDGTPSTQLDVENSGQINVLGEDLTEDMFEDYTPQVTFMPRMGVSFPVTDRALFFASYNVTSQRPTQAGFTPFSSYDGLAAGTSINNPNLKPERTTQYELGFRQRVGERAAVTLSGFYRRQEDKITIRSLNQIGAPEQYGYSTYLNRDFATSKGVELGFDLRRTNNVAINANYTLSFSQGTGSDAATAGNIAWLSGTYPSLLAPTDFDRRHNLNVSVDYRLGENEGPEIAGARPFANFGINVLGTFQSGLPYSLVEGPVQASSNTPSPLQGGINNSNLPSNTFLDLKVDRRFDLGVATLKAYVDVLNVLDTEGVLSIFRATGSPGTDGFLQTGEGQAFVNSATSPASAEFNYLALTGGPLWAGANGSAVSAGAGDVFYAPPRRIRLGLLLDF